MNKEAIEHLKKSLEYLKNTMRIIHDGPSKFNASEPVMQHLNCLWSRLNANKNLLESEPEISIEYAEAQAKEIKRLDAELKAKDELLFAYESVKAPINPLLAQLKAKDELLNKIKEYWECYSSKYQDDDAPQELLALLLCLTQIFSGE